MNNVVAVAIASLVFGNAAVLAIAQDAITSPVEIQGDLVDRLCAGGVAGLQKDASSIVYMLRETRFIPFASWVPEESRQCALELQGSLAQHSLPRPVSVSPSPTACEVRMVTAEELASLASGSARLDRAVLVLSNPLDLPVLGFAQSSFGFLVQIFSSPHAFARRGSYASYWLPIPRESGPGPGPYYLGRTRAVL